MQQQQGYITGAAMRHVAEQIRCTPAEVEDVVSYYTMFYTKPVGKYVLNVCRTLSCALLGAERVTEELSAKLGITPGQTTADGMFTLMEVECLGACDRAPVVMVNDDWHERLAPEQARAVRRRYPREAAAPRSPVVTCTWRRSRPDLWRTNRFSPSTSASRTPSRSTSI